MRLTKTQVLGIWMGAVVLAGSVFADIIAPSVPDNLAVSEVSGKKVDLCWSVSTDNVGVAGYRVYRNGELAGLSATTMFSDESCDQATAYLYSVSAYDAAHNTSVQSSALAVTTGHEYYVSPTGDNAASGSINQPWASPQKAWTTADAGDVVFFRGGDYSINSSVNTRYSGFNGTRNRPVSFLAYPGEFPAIRADGLRNILLLERDYWVIDGLRFEMKNIQDRDSAIVRLGYDVHAHHTVVQNCTFRIESAQGRDNISCIMLHGAKSNYCVIRNNRMSGFNENPYSALANPGACGVQYLGPGNVGSKLLNNEIHNFSLGIHVKHANSDTAETGAEIACNYIYNAKNGIHGNPTHINIHNNLLVGVSFEAGDNGGGPQGHHNVINHNTIYDGGMLFDNPSEGPISDCLVTNNIFMGRIALNPWSYGNRTPHNTSLDNNLYIQGATAFLEYGTHYSLDSWRVYYGGDTHSLSGTPVFVGGANPATIAEFALAADSTGKNAASDGIDMGADVRLVGIQGNHAPALSPINNRIIPAGQPLQITVEASDQNGNELQYSATGGQ